MKTIKTIFSVTSILFLGCFASIAQNPAGQDSIVQVIAESQGLQRVPPGDWPNTGTFWQMEPGGISVPAPCPPQDTNTPVYLLADGQYLVDATAGQLFGRTRRPGRQVSAAAAAVAQAEAVTNLIGQVQRTVLQQTQAQQLGQQQSQSPTNFITGTNAVFTGGLSLEITNVADGLAFLNLCGATNWVYAIWSATNLPGPWQVETEVWPTNGSVMPFTVATAGRDNLFLKAEDWTDVDSNGDGVPDWWLWYWFGNLNGLATDLDIYGNSFLFDFENWFDPNEIVFSIEATNFYVSQPTARVQLNITTGDPAYYAVFVNSNSINTFNPWPRKILQFDLTGWLPLTNINLVIPLGATDGVYDVSIALKGPAPEAVEARRESSIVLDRTPLTLSITNPVADPQSKHGNCTVIKPYLQLQGYANKQLVSLSYDISNAAGVFTNNQCSVTDRIFDTNRADFTTNYFQAYDVPLATNNNYLTFRVTDRAGNTTTTNFNVVLDYTAATNPPEVSLIWPQDGMAVSETNITIRGTMSDETGTIQATVLGGDGTTSVIQGLVERNGDFWLENVRLNGVSQISVQATDAAGNVTTTNFTIYPSTLTLTIDSTPTGDALWQPSGNVNGRISDTTANVFVNGIQGINHHNGTWSASNVPIYGTGTATFDVSARPLSSLYVPAPKPTQVSQSIERPPTVIVSHHEATQLAHQMTMSGPNTGDPNSMLFNDDQINYDASLSVDTNNQWRYKFYGTDDIVFGTRSDEWFVTWTPAGVSPPGWQAPNIPLENIVSWPNYVAAVHYYARGVRFWHDQPPDASGHFTRLWVYLTAGTNLKLYTGGKAQNRNKNLIRLHVNAVSYDPSPADANIESPWWNATVSPITNMVGVQMGTRTPGADGTAWQTLPDNATEDVTVTMPLYYQHYFAEVVPQKYKLRILANNYPLADDRVRPQAYYCVGQKINFKAQLFPDVPNMAYASPTWNYTADYVNNHYTDSHDCEIYNIAPIPAMSNPTKAWFYNRQTQDAKANLGMYCKFSNGQSAYLISRGLFNAYTPTIRNWTPLLDGNPQVVVELGYLSLGSVTDTSGNAPDMSFAHYITSKFSGVCGYTQLVTGEFDNSVRNIIDGYQLDNAEWPRGTNSIGAADTGNQVPFGDGPALAVTPIIGINVNGIAAMDLSFRSYLRFRPDAGNPDDNIFVTLRRVTWGVTASATKTNGVWGVDLGSSASGPFDNSNNDFPVWTNVTHNVLNPYK